MLVKIPRGWELPERLVTPASVYFSRRRFLRTIGGAVIGGALAGCAVVEDTRPGAGDAGPGDPPVPPDAPIGTPDVSREIADYYPAPLNDRYQVTERPLTTEDAATHYNNFYEFTTQKTRVWELAQDMVLSPWQVEVTGLVNRPQVLDLDDLYRVLPIEERVYRHRCVEAWAMTVPWTGFPFRALIERVEPLSAATHVRLITAFDPATMDNADNRFYPWPYYEGLRMDEALNELTFLVTGLYGKPLPPQNGAPLRLAVPWKYGYKSIKSIIRIEFVDEQPATFWNDLAPHEYGFESNVNPDVPHPRWSQATERLIPTNEQVDTLLYNGYGEFVADLY